MMLYEAPHLYHVPRVLNRSIRGSVSLYHSKTSNEPTWRKAYEHTETSENSNLMRFCIRDVDFWDLFRSQCPRNISPTIQTFSSNMTPPSFQKISPIRIISPIASGTNKICPLARILNKRHPSVSSSPDYLKQQEPDIHREYDRKWTGFTHQTGDIFRCG
jgi:hypothetical protein